MYRGILNCNGLIAVAVIDVAKAIAAVVVVIVVVV